MKELKDYTVDELYQNISSISEPAYLWELIRRAKEWEDFQAKNKERWNKEFNKMMGINENQKD